MSVGKYTQTTKFPSVFKADTKADTRAAADNNSRATGIPEPPRALSFPDVSTFTQGTQDKSAQLHAPMSQGTGGSRQASATGFSNNSTGMPSSGVPWLDGGFNPPSTPVTRAPSTPVPSVPVTPAPLTGAPWLDDKLRPILQPSVPVTPAPSTGVPWLDDKLKPILQPSVPVTPAPSTPVPSAPVTPAPSTRAPVNSLTDVLNGAKLGPGDTGPAVTALQKLIGAPETGVFDEATSQKVAELKGRYNLAGDPTVVGKTTLEVFQRNLGTSGTPRISPPGLQPPIAVAGNFTVDTQNPTLRTLATNAHRFQGQGNYSCVASTLINLERLGIPQPEGTGDDWGNNPRGGMVQFVRNFNWTSVPLPGSKLETINSPAYGSVQVYVTPAAVYEELARKGQIPNGAVVMQTKHPSWNGNSDGSRGFDMGITTKDSMGRDGMGVFNFVQNDSPLVYPKTASVILLVPPGALKQQ